MSRTLPAEVRIPQGPNGPLSWAEHGSLPQHRELIFRVVDTSLYRNVKLFVNLAMC